jgi:hypothetical protein
LIQFLELWATRTFVFQEFTGGDVTMGCGLTIAYDGPCFVATASYPQFEE